MNFSSALRLRVIASFLLFGTLLSGIFTYGVYFITEHLEARLVDEVLDAQMDYRITSFHNTHIMPPDRSSQVRGYMTHGATGFGLPPYLDALSPGDHTVEYQGRGYRVSVKKVDDMRFYVVYDLTTLESGHLYLVLFPLAGLVLSVLVASVLAGQWLTRYVDSPVSQLAARIQQMESGATGTRLADKPTAGEISALAAAIDHHIDRIEAFVQRERDFTNDASHELRTPLAALKSTLELLLMEPDLPAKVRERLQRLERSVTEMSDVVSGLLLLAREPEAAAATASRYAVLPVLREAIEQHRYLLSGKPVELVVDTAAQPQVTASPPALSIVLGNLIRNAFNYTTSGRITLRLMPDGASIEDTGIGIAPADLPHVFERHYRGSLAPSMTAGMGLGLSLVQRICDRYGWRLDIASEPGVGTRVHLSFDAEPSAVTPA